MDLCCARRNLARWVEIGACMFRRRLLRVDLGTAVETAVSASLAFVPLLLYVVALSFVHPPSVLSLSFADPLAALSVLASGHSLFVFLLFALPFGRSFLVRALVLLGVFRLLLAACDWIWILGNPYM